MSHGTEGRDGPEHVKAMTAALADRVPVRINRNFMNYPLARDTRAQANWFCGDETGRWMADLPITCGCLCRCLLQQQPKTWSL